jgi:Thiamine pyrophosphate enzyme, N-terminal TPP binding domain
MQKGSDLLVAALENEGVDRIFGVPGEENLDVVESLRQSSVKLVITRHEQAAAFMATTHGRCNQGHPTRDAWPLFGRGEDPRRAGRAAQRGELSICTSSGVSSLSHAASRDVAAEPKESQSN